MTKDIIHGMNVHTYNYYDLNKYHFDHIECRRILWWIRVSKFGYAYPKKDTPEKLYERSTRNNFYRLNVHIYNYYDLKHHLDHIEFRRILWWIRL